MQFVQFRKLAVVFLLQFVIWFSFAKFERPPVPQPPNVHHNAYTANHFGSSNKKNNYLLEYVCPHNNSDCILAFQSVQSLHKQLDDDADGSVDFSESNDFLTEELQYDSGHVNKRQKTFHNNNDTHISLLELWNAWLQSDVHNWSVEQTCYWLEYSVRLPQYTQIFVDNKVNGSLLPRLAVNNMNILGLTLGIKDPIHKQKILLKATDIVLFGSPKDHQKQWKDLVLVTLLIGAASGAYYAYSQNRKSREQVIRMMKDMESLQRAEQTLEHLQHELEEARLQKDSVTTEKETLEKKLKASNSELSLAFGNSDSEVIRLKEELELLRNELRLAEGELKDRCWSAPALLQHWLQFTYEIENKAYLKKKLLAEEQFQRARDGCEKLRKKRSTLVGSFVSTHGKNIDDIDKSIMEARNALSEVTFELRERAFRWKQVESLCGFRIIDNKGLAHLESILYNNNLTEKFHMFASKQQSANKIDNNTDDMISLSSQTFQNFTEKQSASSSRLQSMHSFDSSSSTENMFTTSKQSSSSSTDPLCGPELDADGNDQKAAAPASSFQNQRLLLSKRIQQIPLKAKPPMLRSKSQDIKLPGANSCDVWLNTVVRNPFIDNLNSPSKILSKISQSDQFEDENNSTDESSSLSNDTSAKKKSKNKMNFSSLTKKFKNKNN